MASPKHGCRLARLYLAGLLFLVTACTQTSQAGAPATSAPLLFTPTVEVTQTPSSTPAPIESTPTAAPTAVTAVPTPTPECGENWCIYPGHFLFQRPVMGRRGGVIDPSYRYGMVQNGQRDVHTGVELPAPFGEPVMAAADGKVVVAGDDQTEKYTLWNNIYGNLIILEHEQPDMDAPVYTVYAHLSEITVKVGDLVEAGQVIGAAGFTGAATGPHLHFEVRVGDMKLESTRNPELWLAPLPSQDGEPGGTLAVRLIHPDGGTWQIETIEAASLDTDGQPSAVTYLSPYGKGVNGDDLYQESYASGDLLPGTYRIAYIAGTLRQFDVPVRSGHVTVVTIQE